MNNLTIQQICEAFPDECKTILKREIKRLKKYQRDYEHENIRLRARGYAEFDQWFWLEALKLIYDINKTRPLLERLEAIENHLLNPSPINSSRVTEDQIERVRRFPILQLYAFEKIKRSGQRYQALCPFHTEKSGSFIIYPNNSYHCFGCQANGQDAIAFLMALEDLSFPVAVARLAAS